MQCEFLNNYLNVINDQRTTLIELFKQKHTNLIKSRDIHIGGMEEKQQLYLYLPSLQESEKKGEKFDGSTTHIHTQTKQNDENKRMKCQPPPLK
jgi:hypothetical protein